MKSTNKLKIAALIPARMGSSRFPGKPMFPLAGKPMIGHVLERSAKCPLLDVAAVATCDNEIADYVRSIGGKAIMTGSHHERASDRCAEALLILEAEMGLRFDIVVMVQGDEPLIHPDMIVEALGPMLEDPSIPVTNLLGAIESDEEFEDRNCIKVVCDLRGDALYFSREPIPTRSKSKVVPKGKQVCVIPFRRDFLIEFNNLTPTPLEVVESVDMMRVLEHGHAVRMVPTKFQNQSVDTPGDAARVEALLAADGLS